MDEDTVVWDVVALFPKGVTWDSDPPVPVYYGAPVVDSIVDLREALSKSGESVSAGSRATVVPSP